jgi:hypothetical protein
MIGYWIEIYFHKSGNPANSLAEQGPLVGWWPLSTTSSGDDFTLVQPHLPSLGHTPPAKQLPAEPNCHGYNAKMT